MASSKWTSPALGARGTRRRKTRPGSRASSESRFAFTATALSDSTFAPRTSGNDQLYRNRSTQYESDPDFPWNLLRKEAPGAYESYADVESGAWIKLRIEVSGTKARLYVNGAPQPALIVNDLRLGESRGKIALWARISSEAYFSNPRVEAK
jgi:hypothetical protein